jgi:hypothetical protein
MLRDITAQTIHINTELPGIPHKGSKRLKTEMRVTFDSKGIACAVEVLMTAMEAEKLQKERIYSEPERPVNLKNLRGQASSWEFVSMEE